MREREPGDETADGPAEAAASAPGRERHARLSELFAAARKLPAEERRAYVDRAGDEGLRAELEALLAHAEPAAAGLDTGRIRAALAEAAEPPRPRETPPRAVGPYTVEGVLGRGGMGVVYRARDERLGRKVALKSVPDAVAADPLARARLEREARALASVNHPNVATLYGLEEGEGRLFLVLELVEGESLATRLARGPLGIEETLRVGAQVAAALEEAHERGVVHRDLKPGNVMCGARGRVKLLDFGLALAVEEGSEADRGAERPTREGKLVGTPGYMSPEQVGGEGPDARCDVWAFGCLLYECLSGKPAFPGETVRERLLGPLERQVDWSLLPEGTPAAVRDLLGGCLEREREARPADLAQVRLRLEQALPSWGASEPRPRHSLPAEHDAFVGRTRELEEIAARLESGAGLLTLHGTAGSGKTRLARQFGWRTFDRWPGGVWYADLSEVRSMDGIASAVGTGLGVSLGASDPVVQLGHAIAGRGRCLVILDNFEQVVEHAPGTLGRWTERAREAAFLVTSRRRLDLAGEAVFPVEPLPVVTEGVELFEVRARAQRPDWSAGEKGREAVEDVVRLADSLPLAIELAAARVRVLSPAQIRERMKDRFALLAGGRGPRSRQTTLRGAIDWSWELLQPWERSALAQCSVFEGGFTLEAAEAVIDLAAHPESGPVLDVVQALVDRSLLKSTAGDEEPRFGMHASIKEYAAERLAGEGPDAEGAALARHGAYYARFGSEEAIEALRTHGGVARRRRLERELENLMAACRRAVVRGDEETTAAAYCGTWEALRLRGPYSAAVNLGREWLGPGLGGPSRLRVLMAAGRAHRAVGRRDEAREHFERALALARELGDRRSEAEGLCWLGGLHSSQGRLKEARADLERALAVSLEVGDRGREAECASALGNLDHGLGRIEEARTEFERALAISREVGDRELEGGTTSNLGLLQAIQGRWEEEREYLEQALVIHRETGAREFEVATLASLSYRHFLQGRMDEARGDIEHALAICQEIGSRGSEGCVLNNLGKLDRKSGRIEEARESYERALAIHRELGDRRNEGIVLGDVAELHAHQGWMDDARAAFAAGDRLLREVGSRWDLGMLLCKRGEAELAAGDLAAARAALAEAELIAAAIAAAPDSELGHVVTSLREALARASTSSPEPNEDRP